MRLYLRESDKADLKTTHFSFSKGLEGLPWARIPASPSGGHADRMARQAAPTLESLSRVKAFFLLTGCVTWVRDGITAALGFLSVE